MSQICVIFLDNTLATCIACILHDNRQPAQCRNSMRLSFRFAGPAKRGAAGLTDRAAYSYFEMQFSVQNACREVRAFQDTAEGLNIRAGADQRLDYFFATKENIA